MTILTRAQAETLAKSVQETCRILAEEIQAAKQRGLIIDFNIGPNDNGAVVLKSFSAIQQEKVL